MTRLPLQRENVKNRRDPALSAAVRLVIYLSQRAEIIESA